MSNIKEVFNQLRNEALTKLKTYELVKITDEMQLLNKDNPHFEVDDIIEDIKFACEQFGIELDEFDIITAQELEDLLRDADTWDEMVDVIKSLKEVEDLDTQYFFYNSESKCYENILMCTAITMYIECLKLIETKVQR